MLSGPVEADLPFSELRRLPATWALQLPLPRPGARAASCFRSAEVGLAALAARELDARQSRLCLDSLLLLLEDWCELRQS